MIVFLILLPTQIVNSYCDLFHVLLLAQNVICKTSKDKPILHSKKPPELQKH